MRSQILIIHQRLIEDELKKKEKRIEGKCSDCGEECAEGRC